LLARWFNKEDRDERDFGDMRFEDRIAFILHHLDSPHGVEITPDQGKLRGIIRTLKYKLRNKKEPRVGRYGEKELRCIIIKFKSLLQDDDALSPNSRAYYDEVPSYIYHSISSIHLYTYISCN
jgi:hypothetical protein